MSLLPPGSSPPGPSSSPVPASLPSTGQTIESVEILGNREGKRQVLVVEEEDILDQRLQVEEEEVRERRLISSSDPRKIAL